MPVSFQEVPFLRLLAGWIAGSLAYVYGLDLNQLCLGILFIGLFVLVYRLAGKLETSHFIGSLLILLMVLLGFGRSWSKDWQEMRNHFSQVEGELLLVGSIAEVNERQNSIALTVDVIGGREISRQKNLDKINGRLLLTVRENEGLDELIPGRKVQFKANFMEVAPPGNPRAFSYRDFLARKRIYHQAFVEKEDIMLLNQGGSNAREKIHTFRTGFIQNLKNHTQKPATAGMINGIVLGDRSLLKDEINSAFRDVGAAHVLAVSGLHVGIVFSIFYFFLKNANRLVRAVVILAGVWAFVIFAGAPPSAVRAGSMFSIFTLGGLFGKKAHSLNILAFCAFLHLFLEPNLMRDVGFQFSYLALAGIIIFFRKVNALIPAPRKLSPVKDLISLSIAAQLGVLPLSVYYFGQASPYFMLSSIFSVAGAYLILTGGLITGLLGFVFPAGADLAGWFMDYICGGLAWVMLDFTKLPFATFKELYMNPGTLIVIYILTVITALIWYRRVANWQMPVYSLTVLVFLTGFTCKLDSYGKDSFYIYSTGQGFLADVFVPGKVITLKTPGLTERSENFAASGNRQYYRTRNRKVRAITFQQGEEIKLIQTQYYSLIFSYGGAIPENLPTDSSRTKLIFMGAEEISERKLRGMNPSKDIVLILTRSNSRRVNASLKEYAEKQGLDVATNFNHYFSSKSN